MRTESPELRRGVAVLVFRAADSGHEMLLLKRATEPFLGEWFSVEGKIDDGEGPKDAALRELVEETRLVPAELYRAPESPIVVPSRTDQVLLYVFVAFVAQQDIVVLNEEHSELDWCAVAEARIRLPLPAQRKALTSVDRAFLQARRPSELRLKIP